MGKRKTTKMKKTFDKVTDKIMQLADEMQIEDGFIDPAKVKQLKELTATAKELSAVIRTMDDTRTDATEVSVHFENEGTEWAK